jgi:hypothetical protein
MTNKKAENKNELVLKNGDTIVLRNFEVKPPKGRDFRRTVGLFSVDTKGKQKVEISELPSMIDVLVDKVILKSGEVVEPNMNYYDELDIDDAQTLFISLSNQVSFFMKKQAE